MTTAQTQDAHAKERQLHRDVARSVEAAVPGVEVLALELTGRDRFCVFVDHPDGVDHALCERVSGVLRPYLDEYAVEVSSPGFERPLRTQPHFAAAVGREVKLRKGGTRIRGTVIEAGEQAVRLENDRGEVDIPYDAIVRANLIDEG